MEKAKPRINTDAHGWQPVPGRFPSEVNEPMAQSPHPSVFIRVHPWLYRNFYGDGYNLEPAVETAKYTEYANRKRFRKNSCSTEWVK
ncbi:MAG: hypothetical protein EBS05_04195 [Proteobacteria bacterium]|nr:hypothetical protein [Pseudomonadota bacterium]